MSITRRQLLMACGAGLTVMASSCASRNGETASPEMDESRVDSMQELIPASTLNLFFCASVTKGYANGDCILVEHKDSDGDGVFGLIDTGNRTRTQSGLSVVLDYLGAHGVHSLEFLLITHLHVDHFGDATEVLKNVPVRTLFLRQFDRAFSPDGSQSAYESILMNALDRGVRVIGVDPLTLNPDAALASNPCPSMTDGLKEWLGNHPEVSAQCEPFNAANTTLAFGDTSIQIVNWEAWDDDGNPWDAGSDGPRAIVASENCNSLGVLIRNGSSSAFIAGDMNNSAIGKSLIPGDEDRLGSEIGEVDFFKLSHHGYRGSNTSAFLNALNPRFVQITNDYGSPARETLQWLEDYGVDYSYTTSDPVGTVVTLGGNGVSMGYETRDRFIRKAHGVRYIPAEHGRGLLPVSYREALAQADSWESLSAVVHDNAVSWKTGLLGDGIDVEALRIDVSLIATAEASSTIVIDAGQRIVLRSNSKTTFLRAPSLAKEPMFVVKGELTLEGAITLDGNKNGVDGCSASLVEVEQGAFVVDGAALKDNRKCCPRGIGRSRSVCFGGAVLALGGTVSLRGEATVAGNECIVERAADASSASEEWKCAGGALAVFGGRLEIESARVSENKCTVRAIQAPGIQESGAKTVKASARGGGIYLIDCEESAWLHLALESNIVSADSIAAVGSVDAGKSVVVRGGGCWVGHTRLRVGESSILGNRCLGDEGIDGRGAGLYMDSGTLSCAGVIFGENTGASTGGGAVVDKSVVALEGSHFHGNVASLSGGGLAVVGTSKSRLLADGCTFESNTANSTHGGAVWSNCPVAIAGSSFVANTAGLNGGAVYSNGGLSVDGACAFADNSAKRGNDISVGTRTRSFYAIGVEADTRVGEDASAEPFDDGPLLTIALHPSRTDRASAAIDISASSMIGISEVLVNGEACLRDRYVVTAGGRYEVEARDLAGRVAKQPVEVDF